MRAQSQLGFAIVIGNISAQKLNCRTCCRKEYARQVGLKESEGQKSRQIGDGSLTIVKYLAIDAVRADAHGYHTLVDQVCIATAADGGAPLQIDRTTCLVDQSASATINGVNHANPPVGHIDRPGVGQWTVYTQGFGWIVQDIQNPALRHRQRHADSNVHDVQPSSIRHRCRPAYVPPVALRTPPPATVRIVVRPPLERI